MTLKACLAKLCPLISDLPGPAQSHEPGQAEPVWARPSWAIGNGLALALARLRVAESQSRGFSHVIKFNDDTRNIDQCRPSRNNDHHGHHQQ